MTMKAWHPRTEASSRAIAEIALQNKDRQRTPDWRAVAEGKTGDSPITSALDGSPIVLYFDPDEAAVVDPQGDMGRGPIEFRRWTTGSRAVGFLAFEGPAKFIAEIATEPKVIGVDGQTVFPIYAASGGLCLSSICYVSVYKEDLHDAHRDPEVELCP